VLEVFFVEKVRSLSACDRWAGLWKPKLYGQKRTCAKTYMCKCVHGRKV